MQEKEATTHCGSPLIVGAIGGILFLHLITSPLYAFGEANGQKAELSAPFFFSYRPPGASKEARRGSFLFSRGSGTLPREKRFKIRLRISKNL